MEKKLYQIAPFFEERMWGGDRLRSEFGYVTDVNPIGEAYNVVALPNHADCTVIGENMTLSQLYHENPEWFYCDTEELPIRVNILDPALDLSVQLHPGDEYALKHDNSRGKPEAWVILDTPQDGYIEFGHHARSKKEFMELAENEEYDKLFKYLPAKKDWFIDIPAGTLHAIGKNVLTYNISRDADCTYRLYDYHRIDPKTGTARELHIQKVFDNVNIPDNTLGFVWYEPNLENGCMVTRYWNEPGLYTLIRLQVENTGSYEQERFAFYTVVSGSGSIGGISVKKGDTLFAPQGIGKLVLAGNIDVFVATYYNMK